MPTISSKLILRLITILAIPIALAWFIYQPGFEPFLTLLGGITAYLASFAVNKETTSSRTIYDLRSPQNQRHRKVILQKVKTSWITGYLEYALHGVFHLKLRMDYIPETLTRIQEQSYNTGNEISLENSIFDIFCKHGNSLLILGEPGSGKTITLLELAKDLIYEAEKDSSHPIPVVLRLSSWAIKHQPLKDWLVEEMRVQYQVPYTISSDLIDNDQLILLLDGLNEVGTDQCAECIKAINEFGKTHMASLVVSCRVDDYKALSVRLNLSSAIELKPLTQTQIDDYLAAASDQLFAARVAVKMDALLKELAQLPLFLNIIATTYRNKSLSDLRPGTLEERRQQLFCTYIETVFKLHRPEKGYSQQQAVMWLVWLAQKMSRYKQQVFYLERMQPYWMSERHSHIYGTLVGMLDGTPFLILPGFVFLLLVLSGWINISVALGMTTIVGLPLWFLSFVYNAEQVKHLKIELPEKVSWSLPRITTIIPDVFVVWVGGIYGELINSLIGRHTMTISAVGAIHQFLYIWWLLLFFCQGLFFGISTNIGKRETFKISLKTLYFRWWVLFFGAIIIGLVSTLIGGWEIGWAGAFGFSLAVTIVAGFDHREIEQNTKPNQGFWSALKNSIIVGLFLGFLVGLFIAVPLGLAVGAAFAFSEEAPIAIYYAYHISLYFWLFFGLYFGIIYLFSVGGRSLIAYLVLRYTLYKYNYFPLRAIKFLDDMTKQIIIFKVGGGYVFKHPLLQEYLAGLSKPQTEEIDRYGMWEEEVVLSWETFPNAYRAKLVVFLLALAIAIVGFVLIRN